MSEPTEFGALLRHLRTERDFSQSELATLANMSVEAVSALERGFRKRPQPSTVDLLGTALGLDRDEMQTLRVASRLEPRALSRKPGAPIFDRDVANNIPVHLTSFVGRETEIADIARALEASRLVTIVGPGGIGKTRSSLQIATAVLRLDRPSDGVWFVELAPLTTGDFVSATIAAAMLLNLARGGEPVENVVRALANRTCLIVLDNCEHVIDAIASIAVEILEKCPGIRILASSRQPLAVKGEVVYRLPTLRLPVRAQDDRALTAAAALASPAVALFADRARAVEPRFAVTDENAATIATICERLDGIPLAIELAAPRSTIFTPTQLLDRLDDRFRAFVDGKRDGVPRQQTLRALMDWSYDLLSERERTVFRALGIFAEHFSLEAAIAVAASELDESEAIDVLAALADKSLVIVRDATGSKRFRLLETTRAYAREELAKTSEGPSIALLHLEYLRDLFVESVDVREQTGNGASHERLFARELDDVRLAVDFALGNASIETGGEMLAAINGISWTHIGHGSEGLARLRAFRNALADRRPALVARICAWIAVLARELGRRDLAGEASAMALERARAADDPLVISVALARHANTMVSLERFDEARMALDEAETFPSPSPMQRRRISEAQANLARTSGDLDAAVHIWETLCEQLRSLGDAGEERVATLCLSECEFQRGNIARAIALIESVLPEARIGPDWNLHARALCNLAAYHVALGAIEKSKALAEIAMRLSAARDRSSYHFYTGLEILALLHARNGDALRAARIVSFTTAAVREKGISRDYVAGWIYDQVHLDIDATPALVHESPWMAPASDDVIALALFPS